MKKYDEIIEEIMAHNEDAVFPKTFIFNQGWTPWKTIKPLTDRIRDGRLSAIPLQGKKSEGDRYFVTRERLLDFIQNNYEEFKK